MLPSRTPGYGGRSATDSEAAEMMKQLNFAYEVLLLAPNPVFVWVKLMRVWR